MITILEDDDLSLEIPAGIDEFSNPGWDQTVSRWLSVGLDREDYRRIVDQQDNSISLELEDVRIRRTIASVDKRAYLSVNDIRSDGSSVGFSRGRKASDTEILFDTRAREFTLREKRFQGDHDD